MAEKDVLYVEIVEKEIIAVDFSVIDVVPSSQNLPISFTGLEEYHIIRYDTSCSKWVNVSFDVFLDYFIIQEVPSKISVRQFRTTYSFHNSTFEVYLNGIKEKEINIIDNRNFEFTSDTVLSDSIEVKYIRKI